MLTATTREVPGLSARGESALASRVLSLDVLRGLSVAGMILVTDPGTYAAVYPQLLHAVWTGATATDMIFPIFLFAAGVAIPLSTRMRMQRGASRRGLMVQGMRRCALLILLGLLLNAYPHFHWATLRLPGVLQRIGLCSLAGLAVHLAVLSLGRRERMMWVAGAIVVLLAGYSALVLLVPVPGFGAGHLDTLRSLPAYLDQRIFSVPHLWVYGVTPGVGVTFDPEGLLSTLPATANLLVGVLVGQMLTSEPGVTRRGLIRLASAGTLACVAGLLLGVGASPVMPMIKKLWTPSFALLSSGVSLVLFAALYWVIDVRRVRRGWTPLAIFGTNAIAAFTVSGLLTATLDALHTAGGSNWHAWGYAHLFAPWLPARMASLLYAIAVVAINCAVIGVLYRKRIFVRL